MCGSPGKCDDIAAQICQLCAIKRSAVGRSRVRRERKVCFVCVITDRAHSNYNAEDYTYIHICAIREHVGEFLCPGNWIAPDGPHSTEKTKIAAGFHECPRFINPFELKIVRRYTNILPRTSITNSFLCRRCSILSESCVAYTCLSGFQTPHPVSTLCTDHPQSTWFSLCHTKFRHRNGPKTVQPPLASCRNRGKNVEKIFFSE